MSESVQEASEATEAATETVEPEAQETPDLGDAGKKAIQAEREARKLAEKSATELAAKLKAFEDANLSEIERTKKAAEESAAELAALKQENIRKSVALAKGVPAELIDFLTGGTEEEVSAKADLLMSKLNTPTTPKPDRSQGATGSTPKLSTAEQFAQQMADL